MLEVETHLAVLDGADVLDADSELVEEVANVAVDAVVGGRAVLAVDVEAVGDAEGSMVDKRIVGDTVGAGAEISALVAVGHHTLAAVHHASAIHQIVPIHTLLADPGFAAADTLGLRAVGRAVQLVIAEHVLVHAVLAGEAVLAEGAVGDGAGLNGAAEEAVDNVACFANLAPILALHGGAGDAVGVCTGRHDASRAVVPDHQSRAVGAVGAGSGGAADAVGPESHPTGRA